MSLRFSVITVVYNAESVIEKTMLSVVSQTYLPYEYIIIDGKSSDDTLLIVKDVIKSYEKSGIIFKLISEKDNGIYNAMNKGIRNATGDFISFLNAGDWYEKGALETINNLYERESFDLTYGGLHYINPDGSIINKMSCMDHIVSSRNWNHPSMFLRTELYKKYYFDEKYKICSDFDLYLKLRKAKVKIVICDKVLTNFVADGVSTSTSKENVKQRAKEKYSAYRENGYSKLYWLECYLWEVFKRFYFTIKKKK